MIIHPDQEEFIQGVQRWFNIFKSIDVTLHINKLKNKTHDYLKRWEAQFFGNRGVEVFLLMFGKTNTIL